MCQPSGVIVPVATPLTDDGQLNEPVFRDLLRAQMPSVDGIFVLGSSGELSSLPQHLAAQVSHVAREETAGHRPLYIGVGDTSLPRTAERLAQISAGDAEFVVVAPPYYYPVEQPALIEYFTRAADSSPIPLVLYNIPQNTGLTLETATLRALAPHENIVGIKDSSGDMLAFLRMLDLAGPNFAVLQGREQLLLASVYAGADGIVSSLGNFAPALLRAAIDAVAGGQREAALALQSEITQLATLFDHGYWVAALKAALNSLGFPVGAPVAPLSACDAGEVLAVRAVIEAADPRWLVKTTMRTA